MKTDVLTTVVVCTRDRRRALESCLAALSRQTCTSFEVLVVDNGAAVSVTDICIRWSARYLREPRAGLCLARNAGARHARGEIVAFVDDDAIPEETWLERLVDRFADPAIGAATGGIRYMKSVDDHGEMSAEEAEAVLRGRMVIDRGVANWFALACLGGIGDGMNMAFRKKVLHAAPGFDDRLGRGRLLDGGDEHLMFMFVVAAGNRIAHVPEAIVRHPKATAPELARARMMRERRSSIAYLMFLWGEFPDHRRDLLRHLLRAVAKRLPISSAQAMVGVRLTAAEATVAAVRGVSLYWQARDEWAAIAAPDYGKHAAVRNRA